MSWKDDKDLGPWEFDEQPDKWGYLNNPKWSEKTDAQEFSEAVGNPIDPTNTHVPCGHWHKQGESEEGISSEEYLVPKCCYTSAAIKIVDGLPFIPFVMWMDLSPNGILALIHDYAGRVYLPNYGMVDIDEDDEEWSELDYDYTTKASAWPKVVIVDQDFFAWVNVDYLLDGDQNYTTQRTTVRTYRNGIITEIRDLLTRNANAEYGSYTYGREARKDIAIKDNGTIVTVDYGRVGGTANYSIAAAVSNDYGVTWSFIEIVNSLTWAEMPEVKIDSNGNFWITFYHQWGWTPDLCSHPLYKSTDDGATWSYVNQVMLTQEYDDETNPCLWIDGTTLYIVDDTDKYDYPILHKSTDGGVSFTPTTMQFNKVDGTTPRDYTEVAAIAVSGSTLLAFVISGWYFHAYEQYIYRSTDGGSTWDIVQDVGMPDIGTDSWHLAWGDFSIDEGVWILCAQEMYRISDVKLGYWISYDDGVTWEWKSSIVSYGIAEEAVSIKYTGTPELPDEPQVWPM